MFLIIISQVQFKRVKTRQIHINFCKSCFFVFGAFWMKMATQAKKILRSLNLKFNNQVRRAHVEKLFYMQRLNII